MKLVVTLLAVMPMLWSCSTGPTRPAVDASLYHFDLDVEVAPQIAEFDPNVAKGGGSGMWRGAGMGLGGCIYVGASLDGAGNGGAFPLATVLGIIVSPACAVVGGFVGGVLAETKEDIAARTARLNEMAEELGYPSDLARLVKDEVRTTPVYQIVQPGDGPGDPLGGADPVEQPAPTNASIRLNITSYGLVGGGIDPKMPLQLAAELCVTQYETGEALAFSRLVVTSKAAKLEDWAELDAAALEAETRSLIQRLSKTAQAAMGRQVKVDYKPSCA